MELLEFDFFFFLLVCFKHLKQNHYVKKVYMHWKTKNYSISGCCIKASLKQSYRKS